MESRSFVASSRGGFGIEIEPWILLRSDMYGMHEVCVLDEIPREMNNGAPRAHYILEPEKRAYFPVDPGKLSTYIQRAVQCGGASSSTHEVGSTWHTECCNTYHLT